MYRRIPLLSLPEKVCVNASKENAEKNWNWNWRMARVVFIRVAALWTKSSLRSKLIFEKSWEYGKDSLHALSIFKKHMTEFKFCNNAFFAFPTVKNFSVNAPLNRHLLDYQRWSPRGHILKSLALASKVKSLALASSPRKLACPRFEDSTIFWIVKILWSAWKIFWKTFFCGDCLKNFCEDLFFFLEIAWKIFVMAFFLENTCACVLGPWPCPRAFLSLASRVSVLGKAVLGLGLGFFLCPWPWPRALCPRLHLCRLGLQTFCWGFFLVNLIDLVNLINV